MFNEKLHKMCVTCVTPTCVINYVLLAVTLGYEQLLDDITLVSTHGGVIRNK